MKLPPSRCTTTPKRGKIPHTHKNTSMLVHIVELSTALLKVDTKVINASLTQNQCLHCVPPASMHAEITATARRHWTEQWRHDQVGWRPPPSRTEFINFSERDLIDDSSFCSHIPLAINSKSMFTSDRRHLHDVGVLDQPKYTLKYQDGSCQNYETTSTFASYPSIFICYG